MSGPLATVVVAGAAAAGMTVVETLRREGHDGRIVLVGAEPHLPYDRPPLSKQVLAGTWEPERSALRDRRAYERIDVELRLGVPAASVDVAAKTVTLADDVALRYGTLVVATGVIPRQLAAGHELAGVHVLRTLDDALGLRACLAQASHLVVIGAGFLGSEVAATARATGLDVTIVDPSPVPMSSQFGEQVGRLVAKLHQDHGVRLRTGIGVTKLLGDQAVRGVQLTDGTTIDADAVLVAIGSVPATDWLNGSGLRLEDGVACDAQCRAAPDVYAAGDVARWHNPRFGVSMRMEHRMNATEQAIAVARNVLGRAAEFAPVPYFWTDQFAARIQAYGIFSPASEVIISQGDPTQRRFIARYVRGGRITGVLGWNMPRELRAEREQVTDRAPSNGAAGGTRRQLP